MKELVLFGLASQKIIQTISIPNETVNNTSLLTFLMEKHVPIASSCLGEGICKKCVVLINEEKVLACKITLIDIFAQTDVQTLKFSYL